MTLRLVEIYDLACRFVPRVAVDPRLHVSGARSWWPAHEIGHFLVATPAECHTRLFDLDDAVYGGPKYHYVTAREIAATAISQHMLRRSGHRALADQEIEYTDEDTLSCAYETWCKRAVARLRRMHKIVRLPTTRRGMEILLTRKACEVGTKTYPSRRAAERAS